MRVSDQEYNRLKVLKALRRSEPVARVELAKLTGLAGGTITEVTSDLVRRRILVEERAEVTGRGRPRMEMRINPAAAYVVGCFIFEEGAITTEIVNLRGDSVFSYKKAIAYAADLEGVIEEVATCIDEAIANSHLCKTNIQHVGVAMPAQVDRVAGVVHWVPTMAAEPVPFAAILERRLRLPVIVDNIANVMARAEHWYGTDDVLDDFSLISLDLALTAAHYARGVLWTGAHGLNPEMGHVKISYQDGRLCYCGGHGCLAAYSTIFGIVGQACERLGRPMPALGDMRTDFRQLVEMARSGQREVLDIFDLAGKVLGIAVANHINSYDPGRIILLCSEPDLPGLIADAFHAAVDANVLPVFRGRADIDLKLVGEEQYAKGAAALVLEQLYHSA